MAFIDIVFSEFAPDRGGTPWPEDPGYLVDAENIWGSPSGYRVFPPVTTVSSAATVGAGTYLYGFSASKGGQDDFFVGSNAPAIYQSDDIGVTWNDVSPTSTLSSTTFFDHAQFDDLVIMTNAGPPQRKSLNDSTATLFTALGGSPPNSGKCARVRDHLVLSTAGGLRWSSIGDPEDFPTPGGASALASQAGSYSIDLQQGAISALEGGEKFGLIFQENGITRMTYVGGNVVYQFDPFETNIGTENPGYVERVGNTYYFANLHGVWATDGYKVWKVSSNIDEAIFQDTLGHPEGQMGEINKSAHMIYKNQIMLGDNNDVGLVYNYVTNRFSTFSDTDINEVLFSGKQAQSTNRQRVYTVTDTGKLALISNDNSQVFSSTIALQTGFIEIAPGHRVQLQGAHLIGSELAAATLSFKGVDDYDDVDVSQSGFTAFTSPARDITFTGRDTNRFFAFRATGAQTNDALLKGMRIYFEVVESK